MATLPLSAAMERGGEREREGERGRDPAARPRVGVIGGGLSGLCCAERLVRSGISVTVFEKAEVLGGRMRSDQVDGFTLDRGAHAIFRHYPEFSSTFDMDQFSWGHFGQSAGFFDGFRIVDVGNPMGNLKLVRALFSTGVTLIDYIKIFLRYKIMFRVLGPYAPLHASRKDMPVKELFEKKLGLSQDFVRNFFTPSFQPIFLCPPEEMSSQAVDFIMTALTCGGTALPAGGVQAVVDQLARRLPDEVIRLGTSVEQISKNSIRLHGESDETLFDAVVVAADWGAAAKLVGKDAVGSLQFSRSSTTWYFRFEGKPPGSSTPHTIVPVGESMVDGVIINLAFVNSIQPAYAPMGWSLCQVTTVGLAKSTDELSLKRRLEDFFGPTVHHWDMMSQHYEWEQHQPSHLPRFDRDTPKDCKENSWMQPARLSNGVYCCGDYRAHPGFDGAIKSGKAAAAAVCEDLGIHVASASLVKPPRAYLFWLWHVMVVFLALMTTLVVVM
ncbi:unnamed protein product [Polarella glacialis]|uniref:Amine oxidase domain-containing protein n=1 Tax=Polarella glacialis TaxID=89957 RepID=A0A813ISS5_POLGL|nr:unnamed protein product [Polarella glacialis]